MTGPAIPSASAPLDRHEWVSFEDPEERRTWVFDLTFLLSRWTCIFGAGCRGVLDHDATELGHGCCSHGAHFVDDGDREATLAAVASLGDDDWQHRRVAARKGVVHQNDDGAWTTTVHKGACIMLNRADFPGGAGCALHVAAVRRGLHHMALKPEVCWQLPLRRVDSVDELGHVTSTIREWKRRDWGEGGDDFHWWCTESPDAFVGSHTVLATMADELRAMTTPEVYDLLLAAVAERATPPLPHPAAPTPVAAPRRRR